MATIEELEKEIKKLKTEISWIKSVLVWDKHSGSSPDSFRLYRIEQEIIDLKNK